MVAPLPNGPVEVPSFMVNVVELVTSTSKYPPGNGAGEIKEMFWLLPVDPRSLPSKDLFVAIEEAAVSIGALKPEVHVQCWTASTSEPDA